MSAKGVLQLSHRLLTRIENPFDYLLPYKVSQDHRELLFSCIRGRNGFNNNPNVQQFKYSMQKILLRVSLIGSKNGNCTSFEEEAQSSLFTLNWTKNRTPLVSSDPSDEDDTELKLNLLRLSDST